MQLTWLGAAGFKVDTSEGATLLINPYLSRPALAQPHLPIQLTDLAPVDEIFLTDGRFDHALDTPALAQQTGAIVHAVEPVCQRLLGQGVSAGNLENVIPQTPKRVGSLSWQAFTNQTGLNGHLPAVRQLIRNLQMPAHLGELVRAWPPSEEVAFSFRIDGLSIVHFSSTHWSHAEISQLQPDLALLPVERNPDTSAAAARLAALLQPKVVIPHHWDNYFPPLSELSDLTKFETTLNALAPQVRVYKPVIGRSFDPITLLH
ncbi:MAG: MBL fold metallo-hydrolase [Anaerolineales bacterium]|nr:MBL fold metallo-hydrolase [Anaerolineales bacterium]